MANENYGYGENWNFSGSILMILSLIFLLRVSRYL